MYEICVGVALQGRIWIIYRLGVSIVYLYVYVCIYILFNDVKL